jgi:hypothetical protein
LSAEEKKRKHCQAHMTTALASVVASGDMFTMLTVDQIQKEGTAKPMTEHLRRSDFEPANRKKMFESKYVNKWIKGEKKELAKTMISLHLISPWKHKMVKQLQIISFIVILV